MDNLPTLRDLDDVDIDEDEVKDYDIDPVDFDIKGFEDEEEIIWTGHPHVISELGQILFGSILFIFSIFIIPLNYTNNISFMFSDMIVSWYHIGFFRYHNINNHIYNIIYIN